MMALQSEMTMNSQRNNKDNSNVNTGITADKTSSQQMFFHSMKITAILIIIAILFHFIPARTIHLKTPVIQKQNEYVNLTKINPFQRRLDLWIMGTQENIQKINIVEGYSMRGAKIYQNVLQSSKKDIESDCVLINENQKKEKILKCYIGDVHVLQQSDYTIKIIKQVPSNRVLQAAQSDSKKQMDDDQPTNQQKKDNKTEMVQNNKQQKGQNQKQINESNQKNQNPQKSNENQDKKQKQPNLTGNAQQPKSPQQSKVPQQQKNPQQPKQKQQPKTPQQPKKPQQPKQPGQPKQPQQPKAPEQPKKPEQPKQPVQPKKPEKQNQQSLYTVELNLRSNSHTIIELIIRYISVLSAIYVYFDHKGSSLPVFIICLVYANPLIFIQIGFPSQFSNFIDTICDSSFTLYFGLWLVYTGSIHWNKSQLMQKAFYLLKFVIGFLIYLLEILIRYHIARKTFNFIQTILIIVCVIFLLKYIWKAVINYRSQLHRHIIFAVLTLYFLFLLQLSYQMSKWHSLVLYMVVQIYGLQLLRLTTPNNLQHKLEVEIDMEKWKKFEKRKYVQIPIEKK